MEKTGLHLHDGEDGVDLHDAGVVLADDLRHSRRLLQGGRGELVERYFVLVDFLIREVVRLYDVYLLGDLLHHFLDGVRVCPCGDGVFVHARNGRGGHVQALDVDLPAGEYRRHLVEQAGDVLRMNDDGI